MSNVLAASSVVGVTGSGVMGAGIAQIAAAAAHAVKLHDTRPEAVDKAIAAIRKTFGVLSR